MVNNFSAYQMVHNRYFYALEFVVAILLMSLAFIEYPAVLNGTVNPIIHGLLELFFLGIISIESVMKIRWMSPRVFFRHKRSMIKVRDSLFSFRMNLAVMCCVNLFM